MITVTDTGIGIPRDLVPRVFDLFARFHPQSESGQSGLGIGLALVRRLVEMHGGTVTAHSDGPGRGCEFVIRLPLLAAASPVVPEPDAVLSGESRRILIADDNHEAAEALGTLLTLRGHDVRIVHDGVEALAVAKRFTPTCCCWTSGCRRMDGYETARQIRRRPWGKRAIIVALTGWGQQQDRQRTAAASFDVHLVKPVTETELLRAMASVRT